MAKPLALPNVSNDAIAIEAYRIFGAKLALEAEVLRFDQTKREVAERGVDPSGLLTVLQEANTDPTDRIMKERTLAQYASVLRAPTLRVDYGDLLDAEPEPETDEERMARIQDEGFWAFITHRGEDANPYADDDATFWLSGWIKARELIGLSS